MSPVRTRAEPGPRASLSRRAWFHVVGGACVFAAAGVLAACAPLRSPTSTQPSSVSSSATPTPGAAATAAPSSRRTTLHFWTQWSGKTRQIWEALNEEFQTTHPTIAVASTFFSLRELQESVVSAAATRTLPDLWINAAMVPSEFILDGVVASLNTLGPVPTDFYPAADPACVYAGQRWGVPNNGGVPVIWYNANQFSAAGLDPSVPPRTWDDLLRYGTELTDARQGTWGLIVPNRHYPWTTECWYGFLLEAGGDIFAPNQQTITFADSPGIEALTFWANLFQTQRTAPLRLFDADSLITTYGTGSIGIFPMYSVEGAQIQSFPFPTRNTPYPMNRRRGAHFAGNYTTISARTAHPAEAYTWCAWWWQPAINAAWCAGTGGLPSRLSTTAYPSYQKFLQQEPLIKASMDSLSFARAMPSRPGILEIEQRISEAIYNACFGYKTPKQALDDAVPAVHAIVADGNRRGNWDIG